MISSRDGRRGRAWAVLPRPRLRAKLATLTAAATAVVLAAAAYVTVAFFRRELLQMATEASSAESDALLATLEEQMIANDRKLVKKLVADIGREPSIAWVGILDRSGTVKLASNGITGQWLGPAAAPECQVCHALPPAERLRTVTMVRGGAGVLRTVTPIRNRSECHRCHDPKNRINGVLIVDRALDALTRTVLSDRRRVVAGGALALVALLATLGLAIERLVLQRLQRLGLAARALGAGNLGTRARDDRDDEIGDLAADFNIMAERLTAAMATVTGERRRLDELLNGIADGVVLLTPDLKVITANRAFSARLPPWAWAAPGAEYAELSRAAGFAFEAGSPAARAVTSGAVEKEIVRVSYRAGERYEEVYAQPLRSAPGAIASVVEIWRDITDRKALEAGLEHSERLAALGMLASGIAHEVGNPLASIVTAVEGLLRRLDEPAGAEVGEIREYLEIVRKQVFRCHDVTERLLEFARVPSGALAVVDPAEAVREVVALVSPQARAQGVALRLDLTAGVLAIAEDRLLQQVVLNLVLNALRAMPGGGELRLSLRADEGARLTVSDSGPGIPPEMLRHLFDPLRRGGVHRGTGLGLFLCNTLVRRCGGSISVESEPGKGSAFTVRLQPAPPVAPSVPDAPTSGGQDADPHRG